MKVDAVSSVNYLNKTDFVQTRKTSAPSFTESPISKSDLAKVPVIVLLAMNPATLNSASPIMTQEVNENRITVLAPETSAVQKSDYIISPVVDGVEQSGNDFVLPQGNPMYVQDFDYFNHKFKVVYASTFKNTDNDIRDIYFYKDGERVNPAIMRGLVYHEDPATGKNFYGAIIRKNIYKDYKCKGSIVSEIELPKFVSDYILKVMNNETKFINNLTMVDLYESKSLRLMKSKVTKYD